MNLISIILAVGLAVAAGVAVVSIVRKRKKGGCCGGCSGCAMAGSCHKKPSDPS